MDNQASPPAPDHRPFWRPALGRCLNIAHRGARSLAPENTLAAAAKGLALGADFWELDVARTSDAQLVVLHDDKLTRTSNASQVFPGHSPWPAHKFSLAQLKSLDFGSWFLDSDPFGSLAEGLINPAEASQFRNLALPSLAEALEFSKANDWPVNVEIKNLAGLPGHATIAAEVMALIKDLGMTGQVLISSFNWEYLLQIGRMENPPPLGVLTSIGQADPVRLVQDLKAQTYHPASKAIQASQIENLTRAGIPTLIFTVNEPDQMAGWIKAGAAGLFTDFPQHLARLVKQSH